MPIFHSDELKIEDQNLTIIIQGAPGTGKSIDHVFYHPDEATALRHHIARNEVYEYSASDHCAVWADLKIN